MTRTTRSHTQISPPCEYPLTRCSLSSLKCSPQPSFGLTTQLPGCVAFYILNGVKCRAFPRRFLNSQKLHSQMYSVCMDAGIPVSCLAAVKKIFAACDVANGQACCGGGQLLTVYSRNSGRFHCVAVENEFVGFTCRRCTWAVRYSILEDYRLI